MIERISICYNLKGNIDSISIGATPWSQKSFISAICLYDKIFREKEDVSREQEDDGYYNVYDANHTKNVSIRIYSVLDNCMSQDKMNRNNF